MAANNLRYGHSTAETTAKGLSNNTQNTANAFANDGSFLEMFKKRMEEMEKAKNVESERTSGEQVDNDQRQSRTPSDGKRDTSTSEAIESNSNTPTNKAVIPMQGKRKLLTGRMGGATKQLHIKKKKEEKIAEQEKNAAEKAEDKNTAWKLYMEEVKRYRETSCTEEVDRVRPLVK